MTQNVFQKGDILYGKLRPNLNKVYLADRNGICSTDILVFRLRKPNLAVFYKHFFLSNGFNLEVVKTVSGQQLPRTSWNKISNIASPPLNIKQDLVAKVEMLDAQITELRKKISTIPQQKEMILKRYLE